jgi:lipopolysaccharide heptosyltransferase I
VNRILLVRLGALGDIVHAIPVAAALRRAYPAASIDWLVSAKHSDVLRLVPALSRSLVLNDRGDASGGSSLLAALSEIRRMSYDVAIDLQGLLKSAVIARLSGARRVVGFNGKYARESLARLFYTDVHDPGGEGIYAPSETRHVVEINLGLLTPLGLMPGAPEFPIDVPRSAIADAVKTSAGGAYALLNPGAAWPNKRWPPTRMAALAVALRSRRNLRSVVIWGPGETSLAEEVVALSGGAAVLAPKTTIADLAAIARDAAVMVSGDTGPTHLAAALGTPIVGIYGPTRPERNGPWMTNDESVSRASMCRCHHLRQCRAERMCLLDIELDEVLAAVERRLDAAERIR